MTHLLNHLNVLFIGGTGIISSACANLSLKLGAKVTLITRGQSKRPIPKGAVHLKVNVHDQKALIKALEDKTWDVVVEFLAYSPKDVERDIKLFSGKTEQYIFISSASAYQKPPTHWPITEDVPLKNPFWTYSQNKILCEEILLKAYRKQDFPVTIVRPSHTYDDRTLPLKGGYTNILRLKQGKPVIIHGDGTSLWTLTHHLDFAKGFVGLLGNPNTIGEAFHITSDEFLTWNQIAQHLADAAGLPLKLEHFPSEILAEYDQEWGGSLLGDKRFCLFFDNSKIKRFVPEFKATIPFDKGAKRIIQWYERHPKEQIVDSYWDSLFDQILAERIK